MAKEIELKLACDTSGLAALRAHAALQDAATQDSQQLEAVYFDTPDGSLRKAGFVLRVRRSGETYVQTAKAGGDGLLERDEWERAVSGPEPDRKLLARTPLAKVVDADVELVPQFHVSVARHAFLIERDSSRIEVALDEGRITRPTGKRKSDSLPVSEIELELKKGSASDLFALARAFGADVPLRLGVRTKAERGFALIDGKTDKRHKAEPVVLTEDMSAADAFRTIAHACLRHMRMNEDILLNHRDADALHQMRVAIRRLRSAFSLFGNLLADDRSAQLQADLKRLTAPLGEARNLDVFLNKTLPAERARHPDEGGLLDLEKHLEARRSEAYAAVSRTVTSDEWRTFLLELVAWINTGNWLSSADKPKKLRPSQPAEMFAASVLEKRRRQVKKRGQDLQALSVEERHRVRIAAKKLRYGAEFFEGLYTGKKARKRHVEFVAALEQLQDNLGELNDIATGREVIDGLAGTEAGAGSTLFAAGLTAADIEARSQELLVKAAEAHAALIDVRPFWR